MGDRDAANGAQVEAALHFAASTKATVVRVGTVVVAAETPTAPTGPASTRMWWRNTRCRNRPSLERGQGRGGPIDERGPSRDHDRGKDKDREGSRHGSRGHNSIRKERRHDRSSSDRTKYRRHHDAAATARNTAVTITAAATGRNAAFAAAVVAVTTRNVVTTAVMMATSAVHPESAVTAAKKDIRSSTSNRVHRRSAHNHRGYCRRH